MPNSYYSGTLSRRYQTDVPADPGWARPRDHAADAGHLVDTSGRDEAPRGGGWMPLEYLDVQPDLPGGSPEEFTRTHDSNRDHSAPDRGGVRDQAHAPGAILRFLQGASPDKPNTPADLTNAGALGAAHGGLRDRGMDPSQTGGRRTVDGRTTVGAVRLGQKYTHPIQRVRRPLHFNVPKLRRVLAGGTITKETSSKSPGGYSSQYDPTATARSAGPSQPNLRRLIRGFGQAEYNEISQSPTESRAGDPGPIGNGGW